MESKIRHNESIYETETESKRREQTCGCQGGGGKDWEFETSSCKLVYTVAVLNLLGTREWFYGRQFFQGLKLRQGDGECFLDDSSALYLLC